MQKLLMVVVVSSFTACATEADDASPRTSDREQAISQILGETFDDLVPGPIGGQNGWEGDCVVVGGVPPNKNLRCMGGQFATKGVGFHGAGSYTTQIDLGPNNNVVNSTQGRVAYEGPEGRVFQILVGCDNIRVAAQMTGPVAILASFPCGSLTRPPTFRVVCNWSTGGTVLSCGAARLPNDPSNSDFIDLPLPRALRPFDRFSIISAGAPGATFYDNVFIWQN